MHKAVIVIILLLSACSNNLPESWSWNDSCHGNECTRFSKQERETLREAFDIVCDALKYCPSEVTDGEIHVIAENESTYIKNGRIKTSAAFNEGSVPLSPVGINIHVNLDFMRSLSHAWQVHFLVHEIIHFGLVDHEPEGIMMAEFDMSKVHPYNCVDQFTVNRWCEENKCYGDEFGTCE
jgi:hypothetical protein